MDSLAYTLFNVPSGAKRLQRVEFSVLRMIMVPGDHAEQKRQVLSSKVLSSKDTIPTLAENAQTAMSALYQVHTVLLNTTGTDSQKDLLLRPLLNAKNSYHKFCENCILFLQHAYGVVDDFIFLATYDFGKQSVSDFVTVIKGVLPRTKAIAEEITQLKQSVPLRQVWLPDDSSSGRNIHAILQKSAKKSEETRIMKGDVDSTHDRFVQAALNAVRPNGKVALETAETAFQKMHDLLQTLEDSWSQDTRSLETFINSAGARPEGVSQIPKGVEAINMGGSWIEYQTMLMSAESSILQTSDVLRVDPPVVESMVNPPRPNMLQRIIQAFRDLKTAFKRG